MAALAVILRGPGRSAVRRDRQSVQQVAACQRRRNFDGRARFAEDVLRTWLAGTDPLEQVGSLGDLANLDDQQPSRFAALERFDTDQLLGFVERQRIEEQRVDEAEHQRVRSEAERQGGDDDYREYGLLGKSPQSAGQIAAPTAGPPYATLEILKVAGHQNPYRALPVPGRRQSTAMASREFGLQFLLQVADDLSAAGRRVQASDRPDGSARTLSATAGQALLTRPRGRLCARPVARTRQGTRRESRRETSQQCRHA